MSTARRAGDGTFTLPSYQRPRGMHPPNDFPQYRSSALRAPHQPLVLLPHRLTEITGPLLGEERVRPADADLTAQHPGEPHGERIIVTGRVLDGDGRPVPRSLVEILAGQRGRPVPARERSAPRAAGSQLHRPRPVPDRRRGQVPVRHDQAGLLPVAQPPECLAARAHSLLAVRPVVHPAPDHPDVLSRRPAAAAGSGPQLGARPGRPAAAGGPLRPRADRAGVGPGLLLGHRAAGPRRNAVRAPDGRPVNGPPLTPSQTVGPFFAIALPWPDGPNVVPDAAAGALVVTGRVLDGAGAPVPDALVETWQAAPDGSFGHPDDPRQTARDPAGRPPASAGSAAAPPVPADSTGSSRCARPRCPAATAAPRRRTWTCPSSRAACSTGW